MKIKDMLAQILQHLDELKAAIDALDPTPELQEIDTRIQALTGEVKAKVGE